MAAIAAVVGASVAVYWPAAHYGASYWVVCASLGIFALVLYRWRRDSGIVVVSLLLAMLYAAVNAQAMQQAQQDWRERATAEPVSVVQGHVVGLPDGDDFRTRFVLREAATGAQIRMSWYRDAPNLQAGQCWTLTSRLRGAHGSVNAGGFDYEQWLFRERLVGSASVRNGERCADDQPARLDRLRAGGSNALSNAAKTHAGSALIPALVVGDRRGLTDDDWASLRRTGTSHLVAISGLHIGLLAVVGYALGAWLWRRSAWLCRRLAAPRAGALLGLLLAIAYAALSGFALPAQRALIMVAVFVACVLLGRGTLAWHALGLAAMAVLLRDPLAPLAPGFWLSFGAVAWIILIARMPLYAAAPSWLRWPIVQLALSLGLLPLTAVWFGEVSVLGPLVNFVLIPIFAVLVPMLLLATAALLAGTALPIELLGFSLAGMLDGLNAVSRLQFGAMPFELDWLAAVPAGLGLALLFLARRWSLRMLALVLIVPAFLGSSMRIAPGAVRVDVFDVGQGLSVLARTAQHALLYDAGPAYRSGFDAGAAIVLPSLRVMGVRKLDRLVVSHGDGDHAGGAPAIRAGLQVRGVLGHGGEPCVAGQSWTWDDVEFEILHPVGQVEPGNNASCVLRIRNAFGKSILLPGDIERDAEAQLLVRGVALRSDVLILPHHGSSSSSSAEFLDAVGARMAIASAGYGNRWGFPTEAVRGRLQTRGVAILSTAHQGQLKVDVGETVRLLQAARDHQPRIWRHQPRPAWIATPAPLSSPDD